MQPIKLEIFLDDRTLAGMKSAEGNIAALESFNRQMVERLQGELKQLERQYRQLQKQGLAGDRELADIQALKGVIGGLKDEIKAYEAAKRQAGETPLVAHDPAPKLNQVRMTMAQIARELPSLAMGPQMFFLAISNNMGTTGARLSEFQQFTWEDIISGEVVLKGKGNKYRRFFFQKTIQQEAKVYAKEYGKTGIFAVGRFGPITQRGFSQHLKAWGKHCGIDSKKMHAHAFRHFFAKMFLKKTKDIIQLADLLGHGSVDTTRIYLQKSYDEQQRDFNKNVTW